MALCKNLTTEFGVGISYHNISLIRIDWQHKTCQFQLDSYFSQEAKEQGKLPILSSNYFYTEDAFTFTMEENIVNQMYLKLKSEEDFIDATDC